MAFTWGAISDVGYNSIQESDARLNIWEGAVRSSKTICSLIRWIEFTQTAPDNGDLVMMGKTERTLKRNILSPLADMLGPKRYRYVQGEGELYISGRKIYVIGANDDRSEGKVRGMTMAGMYGDEVTLWPEAVFKMSLSRMSVSGAKGFYTTNADSPYHWLKTGFIDRAKELNIKVFHFDLKDNWNLPREYVEALSLEYTGLWHKRFIDGLWVVAEGAVYDMFDEDIHVVKMVPKDEIIQSFWLVADYGTSSTTVFLLCGRSNKGNYYVLDEYRWDAVAKGRQKSDKELSQALIDFVHEHGVILERVIVDPSAASFIKQLKDDFVDNVRQADNDILNGIRRTGTAFQQKRLFLLKKCHDTIKELTGLCWDIKAQQLGIDKPIDGNDHGPDALRYFVNHVIAHEFSWIDY